MHSQQASNDFIHSGCTAYKNGQYAKAGRMFIKALKKARQANCEGETICMIRFNLGLYYCQEKRYKKAERCFLSALAICREQNDIESEYRVQMQLAELYARWEKPRIAARVYRAILSTPQIAQRLSGLELDVVFSKLFKLYYTTGKYNRAALTCQEAARTLLLKDHSQPLSARWNVFYQHCIDVQRTRRSKDGTVSTVSSNTLSFNPA